MGQILDGQVTDLELGAFCIAMRIKGETDQEMAGFLDAVHARLLLLHVPHPVVVLPSYNGARKLPVLTPLLAHLLAREGCAVVIHGTPTESNRITSQEVLQLLDVLALEEPRAVRASEVVFVPTDVLCPGLKRLLDVRRVVGLRNSAHSLVKLMNPTSSLALTGARALLLRGTEGEVVADPRRTPQMDAFFHGKRTPLVEAQTGSLIKLPELPSDIDAASTARYTQAVLDGALPVPAPLAAQVQAVLKALNL
jgi:anthranilate phosphoribosyltransferase